MSAQPQIESMAIPKPPAGEIVTPEVLESRYWTSLALARAFSGQKDPTVIYTQMIADDRQAFLYYRELEEKDDDIGGALETMKLSILGREHTVMPANDSTEAADIAKFVTSELARVPRFEEKLYAMLDAYFQGMSIAELMFDVSGGQAALVDVRDRAQEMFSFNPPAIPQVGALRFSPVPFSADGGELVPEEKFLIFSWRPRASNRRGRPVGRQTFWLSWFKRQVLTFWLRFAEKGPGTAAVRYPQGATDDEQKKALQAAEAVISKIAVAIPENFQLVEELLTAARSQNPAAYEKLHDRMQHAIARRILGQTLTSFGSEQGSGSRSLGQVHMDTFHAREVALAGALEDVINDQLVRRLVMWNYGPAAIEKLLPKWTIDKENEDDMVQRSQVDERLQRMGLPIPKAYAQKKYAIPDVLSGDVELTPLQTAQLTQQSDSLVQGADSPTFGDVRRVKAEQRDIDTLLTQLEDEVFPLYQERVLDMVKPVAGGAQ